MDDHAVSTDGPLFESRAASAVWAMLWRYDLTGAALRGKPDGYADGWADAIAHLRKVATDAE